MKYFLFVIGCQMNLADAERAATVLEKIGLQPASSEKEADLIMVLACSVRQSAIDRIYGKINKWQMRKNLTTVLSGCVTAQDKKKMKEKFDILLDINDLPKLPGKLKNLPAHKHADYLEIKPKYQSSFQAFVPISNGCNNYCTYCVVPYTRGRESSRPVKEIICEIKNLIKRGYKEITLVGQNVNSYGQDLKPKVKFVDLLKKVNAVPGHFWIRFLTNHPKDMSDQLIKSIPQLKKVTEYIHLPLQAGDNAVLKRMNRHYTQVSYLKLVAKIKKVIPGAAISTDIIVGFPGETKKQFAETKKVMTKVPYSMAYLAQYSERPGTAAAKLKDDVPKKEKERRQVALNEILKKSSSANNQKMAGQTEEVLVDGHRKNYYYGRTRNFKIVKFKSTKNLIGKFVKIKIVKANIWYLEGKYEAKN
ncbi:MAG: tRNA (N6-isopentenyl adenosine(37)-C2)-methylthiotransferase MiaB [Patescibacteria group bacterium]